MYSVMLVDDDYPVLELLSEMIAWEELGLTLAGTYENGIDAWQAAQQSMPDILVTDIGMPKMNGLDLIRELKGERKELKVVILSCHSEFHYARQAMQLQVQDYIVKDTLDPDDLQQILKRFANSLQEERRSIDEQQRVQWLLHRSRDALKAKWLQSALQQPYWKSEEWLSELRSLGLTLKDGMQVIPTVCWIDDYRAAKQRFRTEHALSFAITNVLEEALRNDDSSGEMLLINHQSNEWLLLKSTSPSLSVNGYDQLRRSLLQLQRSIQRVLKLSISFGIGKMCDPQTPQLKQSLLSLIKDQNFRFYAAPLSMATYRRVEAITKNIFAVYDEACQQFYECILKRERQQLDILVKRWKEFIASERYEPDNVKEWVLKLILDIRLKQHSRAFFRAPPSAEYLHQEVHQLATLFELEKWLHEQMSTMLSLEEQQAISLRKEVMEAYQFVINHMDKRIGLEDVAEHLHLNASYFSRLFKKETGETFIEYVIRTKMKRAKELLDQTSLSIVAICEQLGYDNPSYFNKLFKGCYGLTPTDYRNNR